MRMKFLVWMLAILLVIMPFVSADQPVDMYIFHGQGCSHCAKLLEFMDGIKDRYPTLNVTEYEVYFNKDNVKLFHDMVAAYNSEVQGVPTVFINGKIISGFSDSIAHSLEADIQKCVQDGCPSPREKLSGVAVNETTACATDSSPAKNPEQLKAAKKLTLLAVISGALVDSINPCEFAVLIILLTTILAAKVRKRVLYAGLAFCSSIYISYFLMGLGLFSALQATGLTRAFYTIVAILAIIIGLFNLKDYLWYGKWFIMEVPLSWRPKMKMLLRSITSVPGAFLIGFVISLFLLPCTSGPYIAILGLLAETTTRSTAILYLLFYNLMFILPMVCITLAIYFGITTPEKAEEWRIRKLKTLHLVAGILILLIGIGMLIAMKMGIV